MASSDLVLVEKGDTSQGKCKFFHFHNPKGNYEFALALISGKDHFYRCEIQNTPIKDAKVQRRYASCYTSPRCSQIRCHSALAKCRGNSRTPRTRATFNRCLHTGHVACACLEAVVLS